MIKSFFIVGIGSFFGGGIRFLISEFIRNRVQHPLPWGTLCINLSGCFLIGLLYALFERDGMPHQQARLMLAVGFCGGFTTFSAFVNENFLLLRASNLAHLSAYVALSVVGGMAALYLGHLLVRAL